MIEIASSTNAHFRRWSELDSGRGIKKHQEFILMGEKLVTEFLQNPNFKIKAEIIHEDLKSLTGKLAQNQTERITVFKLPKTLFKEIDTIGTHFNLLVLEPKELPAPSAKTEGLELLCPLGDPTNLGALARSALAFDASKIILTEESCSPYHPKAIKASAGAILKMPLFRTGKFADYISGRDDIYALDLKGENIARFPWPKNMILAIGEEGPGFSGIKGMNKLSIPTEGVESLNATVAASIALYEAKRSSSL